jgi:type II secretory pathway component GspD/PulD (secretin)
MFKETIAFQQPAKNVFFNDRLGVILVRGTEADLDIVQQAIEALNSAPARIVIEAKFVELNQEEGRGLELWEV